MTGRGAHVSPLLSRLTDLCAIVTFVPGLTTLTLLGKEWVSYNVHSDEETGTHTPATRVALHFKVRPPTSSHSPTNDDIL